MKKICIFLAVTMLLSCFSAAFAVEAGLSNFKKTNQYDAAKFSDVVSGSWYEQNVIAAYELGLMKGNSDTTFNPTGKVTIAETIALACRLHSTYFTGDAQFEQGTPWYQVYVDYAAQNGIVAHTYADYGAPATRSEYAAILASSLPAAALEPMNQVDDNAIPDVSMQSENAAAIYSLYRAGILTGNDSMGTFAPDTSIERNAVAAIVTRMADPTLRASVTLTNNKPTAISDEEFYDLLAKAKTLDALSALADYELSDEQFNALLEAMVIAKNGGVPLVDSYYIRAEQGWDENGNIAYTFRPSKIETVTNKVGLECTTSFWEGPGGYSWFDGYVSSADRYTYELDEIPQGNVYTQSDRFFYDRSYNEEDYNIFFLPYIAYLNTLSCLKMIEAPSGVSSVMDQCAYKIITDYGYDGMLRIEWHAGQSQFSTYKSIPARIEVYVNEYRGVRYDN